MQNAYVIMRHDLMRLKAGKAHAMYNATGDAICLYAKQCWWAVSCVQCKVYSNCHELVFEVPSILVFESWFRSIHQDLPRQILSTV